MSSHHLDMLRQVPRTNPPVNMLASLGPSQQFAPQPPNAGAQQLPPHVGIPGNMIPNPPVQMNFVGNAAPQGAGMNNQAAAQAAANMQFRLGPQRTPQQTPGQPGVMGAPYNPMVNGVGGLGAPNAVGPNGLAVNPQAMAAGLPNGVMQQPIGGVRRVPGQPMGMNQGATIPGGMIPMATGVPPGSMVNGNPASVMMQQQIRQQQALAAAQAQQQSNVRLPPQLGPPGAMQMAARPGIHPTAGIIRTTSAQPMLGASPGTQQLPGAPLPNSAPNGFSPSAMMQPQAIQQNGFNSAMQNRPPSVQIAHPASAPPMHPGQPPRTTPDGTAGNMFMSFPGANRMTGIEQPHMNLPPGSSSPPAQQPQHAGDIPQQMVGMHSNVPGRQGLSGIQIQQHVEQLRPGSSSGSQQQGQPPQMQQSPRAAPNVFGLSTQPPPNVPSRPSSQNVMRTPRTPHTPISAPQQTASHHASPRNTPAASPAGMPFPPRPTSQPTVMAGMSPRPSSQPQRIPSGLQAQHMHGNIANGHTRVEPPIQRAPSASAQFPGQGTALTETGQIPQALQGGPFPTPGAPGAGPQQPQRHPSMSLGSTPTQLAIVQRNKATGEAQPMGAQNGPVRPPSSGSMQRAAVPIPPGQMPPTQAGSVGLPIPRPNLVAPASFGQAYHKLLQFSGQLADEVRHNKSSLTFWENLVESYFTPTSITKLTLWREQGNEAKPFEISVPILARYFLVTHQSGVKSMHWSLDGGQETQNSNDAMRLMFNCNAAIWTHRYANGYTIALRGPLQATVCLVPNTPNTQPPYVWKIDSLQFDATSHEKFLSTSAILGHRTTEQSKAPRAPTLMNGATTLDERGDDQPRVFIDKAFIPSEPVNAFGIPQATMRCLELAESVAQMVPLIQYSCDHNLGPLDSLKQYTRELREGTSAVPPHPVAGFAPGAGPSSFSNVPGPSQPPQQAPALSSVPPDSPTKTNRPGPSGAQPPTSTTPAPLPRASSSTPTMTPASLKRKADGNAAASTSEPQPKRNQRKRGGTTSKS